MQAARAIRDNEIQDAVAREVSLGPGDWITTIPQSIHHANKLHIVLVLSFEGPGQPTFVEMPEQVRDALLGPTECLWVIHCREEYADALRTVAALGGRKGLMQQVRGLKKYRR